MSNLREQAISEAIGKTKEVTLPSGNVVLIREQTGEDDSILTNTKSSSEGNSFDKFIAAIVVSSKKHDNKQLTLQDVTKMRLRDKYAILFNSRIFSLGNILQFEYTWEGNKLPTAYEEDLNQYVWDYSKPFPKEGEQDYYKYRIKPYPEKGDIIEATLSSGKEISFNFLDGQGEIFLSRLNESTRNINSPLRARNLKIKGPDGNYHLVELFKEFTSKDMMEIRSLVNKYDEEYFPLTELVNPETNEITFINLTVSLDFFFPLLK